MDSVFRLILRLLLIPTAVMIAATVQAGVILFGQWRLDTVVAATASNPSAGPEVFGAILLAGFSTVALLGIIWTLAAIGILFSEAFAVRSWLFHLANGVVAAFLAVQLFPLLLGEDAPLTEPFYILATGLAGGLVYWLIAGWGAGFWKPVRRPVAERATILPPRAPPPASLPPA